MFDMHAEVILFLQKKKKKVKNINKNFSPRNI